MEARIASRDGAYRWEGPATPYILQWMAGRWLAFFEATDGPVLFPSKLVAIVGDAKEKW